MKAVSCRNIERFVANHNKVRLQSLSNFKKHKKVAQFVVISSYNLFLVLVHKKLEVQSYLPLVTRRSSITLPNIS